jgi:hypothetical protein
LPPFIVFYIQIKNEFESTYFLKLLEFKGNIIALHVRLEKLFAFLIISLQIMINDKFLVLAVDAYHSM